MVPKAAAGTVCTGTQSSEPSSGKQDQPAAGGRGWAGFLDKNPEPMLKQLSVLDAYAYYFQFTLNAYAADVEAALPPLAVRIEIFRQLAQKIGAERMIWRYDPILLSARYDLQYHAAVLRNWQRSWPAVRKNVLSVSLIIILRSRQVCIRQG